MTAALIIGGLLIIAAVAFYASVADAQIRAGSPSQPGPDCPPQPDKGLPADQRMVPPAATIPVTLPPLLDPRDMPFDAWLRDSIVMEAIRLDRRDGLS